LEAGEQYVALLRGITPMNPNMRNEKLRGVFEGLAFRNVRTVIASGNVLFEPPDGVSEDVDVLEATIEQALMEQLGFSSTTIIRSRQQLRRLTDEDPFKGVEHSARSSLNVTFLKREPETDLAFPYRVEGRDYALVALYEGAVCSVTDLTRAGTPDLMAWLEKRFGKEITTRTWATVQRILKRLEEA
jgi:uncharacterized protein (DUF1697 family)